MLPEFAPPDFRNVFIDNLTNEQYHADKSAVSSTSLKSILKSPATFYSQWTDTEGFEPTDAMKFGSLVHTAVLEPERFFKYYKKSPEFGDMRSPKNRAAREEYINALPAGTILVNDEEHSRLEGIVNSVLSHKDANALLKHGQAEISGIYRDPQTGLKCRIRPDFINFELMTLIDLKTTTDCSVDEFSKSIWKYRYDFQMAMYCEAVREITGRAVNYAIYLAIEKLPPYEIGLYVCDESILGKGLEDYRRALDLLAECIVKDKWPPYQSSLGTIHLPFWALNKS